MAGSVGAYMDLENIFSIGMLPAGFRGKIQTAGNSSLAGCIRYLTEPESGKIISGLSGRCREVELAANASFQKAFVDFMEFG